MSAEDLPPRWYVVDRDGLATLCASESDALHVAEDARLQWPQRGPYRAVLMRDVSARHPPAEDLPQPVAWACMWPTEEGCGGGAFTTIDEQTARNYMAGADERASRGLSKCTPTLVPLYTRAALDAARSQERERCAAIVQANADACLTGPLRNVLASNAAAIRAQDQG